MKRLFNLNNFFVKILPRKDIIKIIIIINGKISHHNKGVAMLMPGELTSIEKTTLLKIAREAIISVADNKPPAQINVGELSPALQAYAATFVTLTIEGALRGCIGTLKAYQPLALDVQEHAIAAAFQDYRFPQVTKSELPKLQIEISRLTLPQALIYENYQELISKLRPDVDGVVISDGHRSATFLPQVWEKLPDPVDFLSQLCLKMGAAPTLWQKRHLEVKTYQVEEFQEELEN